MIVCRQTVDAEIFPSARERFFRKINVYRRRPRTRRCDGKRTSVGKTIKQCFGRDAANKLPVRALIDKKPNGISGREIDSVTEHVFGRDALQIGFGIAHQQSGRFALGVLLREVAPKNAA